MTLRYPAQDADPISQAVVATFAQAEGAADATLGESLESFVRRLDGKQAVQQKTPEPEPRPIGVGQGAHKPA